MGSWTLLRGHHSNFISGLGQSFRTVAHCRAPFHRWHTCWPRPTGKGTKPPADLSSQSSLPSSHLLTHPWNCGPVSPDGMYCKKSCVRLASRRFLGECSASPLPICVSFSSVRSLKYKKRTFTVALCFSEHHVTEAQRLPLCTLLAL